MSDVIFFDCETEPTSHEKAIPRCAVCAYAVNDGMIYVVNPTGGREAIQAHLDKGALLVGHNIAFDIAVLGLRIDDWSRVYDTNVRGVLRNAAEGKHEDAGSSLKLLAAPLGIKLGGKGTIQLSFGTVYGPDDCTPEQLEYAAQDVVATRAVWWDQGGPLRRADEERQTTLAAYIFDMARAGVPLDRERVLNMKRCAEEALTPLRLQLVQSGILQPRGPKKNPWRDEAVDSKVVQARLAATGATRKGGTRKKPSKLLAADEEALVGSGDPDLALLAEYKSAQKWLSLVEAFDTGCGWARAFWKPVVASGRISASRPNLTQVPKHGGLRECVRAPAGAKLVAVDFRALEFAVWAATCQRVLGWSRAAQTLQAGADPHIVVAAEILGLTVEDATQKYASGDKRVADARQDAKAVNYGCIAGMGAARLSKQFTDAGRPCSVEEAQRIIDAWYRAYPEATRYFQWLKRGSTGDGMLRVKLPWSGRERVAYFTEAANFMIQGGGADVAKEAMRLAVDRGLDVIMLVHDEIVCLCGDQDADYCATVLAQCCEEAGALVYPEVPWTGQKSHVWTAWPSK
jgi:hypothetical protein